MSEEETKEDSENAPAPVDEPGDEAREGADEPEAAEEPSKEAKGDKSKPLSPGARLAAQRAARSAQKAAKRGRQKNEVEVRAQKRAEKISKWYEKHRVPVLSGLGAAALLIAGFIAWTYLGSRGDESAAAALAKAVDTEAAPIRNPDDVEAADLPASGESYPTVEARNRRALAESRDVLRTHAGTRAAVWARLGEARALLDLGQGAQARESYEKALHEAQGDATVLARAYEGLAFTYEAEGKTSDAVTKFQQLSHAGDGAFRDLAEYHLARMYLAQHQNDRAKETLRVLVNRLRERDDSEEGAVSPFVLTQAELRLAELDSSLVPRGGAGGAGPGGGTLIGPNGERMGAGGPGGAGGISDEQLQDLIRRLQAKQGAGGGAAGGSGGGGE